MADRILPIADGFWNIRGSHRFAGLINIGNQSSLVRLASGRFVLLDSYDLQGEIAESIMEHTEGGKFLESIIHLHPFHTIHVPALATLFPQAKLYGTTRHKMQLPTLQWQPEVTEGSEFSELYREDFDFTVPPGVHFVPNNHRLHFASVLAIHRQSQTLHVDDTLNWEPLPWGGRLSFHPSLRFVLQSRDGAADDFRTWASELVTRCKSVRHICTAHAAAPPSSLAAGEIAPLVQAALDRKERLLRSHAERYRDS